MALTNLSSCDENIRDKIVQGGTWSQLSEILRTQDSNNNAGSDSIRLAACELMANLSLTSFI